jgi:hypothetical protein
MFSIDNNTTDLTINIPFKPERHTDGSPNHNILQTIVSVGGNITFNVQYFYVNLTKHVKDLMIMIKHYTAAPLVFYKIYIIGI